MSPPWSTKRPARSAPGRLVASATVPGVGGRYRPGAMQPSRLLPLLAVVALAALTACAPSPARPGHGGPTDPVAARLLVLVNERRSRPATCGSEAMRSAPRLTLEARLISAARAHSADQARNGFMGHQGSDGSTVGVRVTRTGYSWSLVAENVAWNQPTPEAVVAAWMASPGHCQAIMNQEVRHLGAAEHDLFWTLVFARPR